MDELDDFMKQKLGNQNPYPFKESYWEQAEALLDEARYRKKRKRWRWLLLLLLLLTGWCTFVPHNRMNHKPSGVAVPDTSHGNGHVAHPSLHSRTLNPGGNTHHGAEAIYEHSTHTATPPAGTSLSYLANTVPMRTNERSFSNFSIDTMAGAAGQQVSKPFSTDTLAESALQETTAAGISDSLALLPSLPMHFLSFDTAHLLPALVPVSTLVPPKGRTWRFGTGLYGTAYSGRAPGAALQVFAERKIRKSWAVEGGLQYRYRPYDGQLPLKDLEFPPLQTVQDRYSFGLERTTYSLELSAQHWLEVTLGLHYQYRAFRASGGIAPGLLLAVSGHLTTTREISGEDILEVHKKPVRVSTKGYTRFYAAPWTGVSWQPGQKCTVTVRGYWQPGSWPFEVGNDGNQLWLDAGVRYNFYFNK